LLEEEKPLMLANYISIARPDHWFKNIFMLPGFVLAIYFSGGGLAAVNASNIILAILSICLLASANYTINEWLDAETDRHHPVKKDRPSVVGAVTKRGIWTQWLLLVTVGLLMAYQVGMLYFGISVLFIVMGVLYNVPPFRTKEVVYLDVLSESINNPIRLLLGWSAILTQAFPPSSIILAYWMGGAFLMAIKRFAEFRYIGDPEKAGLYRSSFVHYSEQSLLLSAFCYALTCTFLLGIFLIKYRVEYILSFPFLAILFVYYFSIALKDDPVAQTPEKLYQEKGFVAYTLFLVLLFVALTLIDMPVLEILLIHLEF
jgi:4-hydroxybenzoate polyprenyltransferase